WELTEGRGRNRGFYGAPPAIHPTPIEGSLNVISIGLSMLFLSDQQVRDLADVEEVICAIRAAFAREFSATLRMPPRTSLEMTGGAILLVMPAFDSFLPAAGVKLVTVSREAGVVASYDLLDPDTGGVLSRMEANYLTDLRTAATSAVATDLLAR